MAVTIIENPKQEATMNYRQPTAARTYKVCGSLDKTDILLAIAAYSPQFDTGIDAQTALPITIYRDKVDVKEIGGGVWEATVKYSSSPNTIELTFNFGVKTAKIFTAIQTIRQYDCIDGGSINGGSEFGNCPDFKNQINVTAKGVQGVDIEIGSVELAIIKKWKRALLPASYLDTIKDMLTPRPAVNSTDFTFAWLGQTVTFKAGNLRIRTVPMKWDSEETLEISYHFVYERDLEAINTTLANAVSAIGIQGVDLTDATGVSVGTQLKIGGELVTVLAITGSLITANFTTTHANGTAVVGLDTLIIGASDPITKKGHELLTINYKTGESAGQPIQVPVSAIISQVYPERSFDVLQI